MAELEALYIALVAPGAIGPFDDEPIGYPPAYLPDVTWYWPLPLADRPPPVPDARTAAPLVL